MVSKAVRVTAHECKTKQAEVFRRAAAGETIIVTNNGMPQVEIRKAPADTETVAGALEALRALHASQLATGQPAATRNCAGCRRRSVTDGWRDHRP